ncbi:PAS domain S-box protein [Halopenitus sp. H-Gu1]|uniref:PAS domain S-box protein n=1 Tax=Halopenitus sp. H-Gu1 TaxID=3242697 RepID=UPI00359D7C73
MTNDSDRGEIRVLHVDDDPEFTELTTRFLERADNRFTVETAHSVEDALDRLDGRIDCIVSGCDIPDRDGLEFFEEVETQYPDLPFILFTGTGSEEIASHAISMDVTDYLQKRGGSEQYELLANRIENAVSQARTHQQAAKYRRVSTAVRDINQVLVQATTREEINQEVCRILTESAFYRFAWIGTADPETNRIIPEAAAGVEDGYLDTITVTVDEEPTGRGPGGTALREGEIAVSQNITHDDAFEPWREEAIERGYRAVAGIPLAYEDTDYGVLCVYAERPNAFNESERDLLEELSDTIAHAYNRLDIQRAYENQYRELFEEAPVMFAFTRTVGENPIIDDCNQLFAETLGYSREKLRGRPLADVYTEESTEALLRDGGYDRALTGEFTRESRHLLTRDGDEIETLLRATPRRNKHGEIVGTHALYVDVTDRTRLETLEALRERMEFALDATHSILFEIDLRTQVVTRLGPFERLYGVASGCVETSEEFYEECVHPDDREELEELQRSIDEDTTTVGCEFRTHPDRGEERWIRFEAYVSTDADGTPQRLVGLDTDITEQKRREQELERQNERLEEFASIVSHDLRNPLNVAEGRTELAIEDCDSPHLDAVKNAHERMSTLIEDLLTLAREGEEVSTVTSVDLAELCERCWSTVDTDGATLMTRIDRSIEADRRRLQQLLENLFRNAIEHGGKDVTVTVGECEGGFYVADDGSGIPEADRDEVFSTGFSTAESGTGFGLQIVKQVVDAHGWTIEVTDGREGGARFEITGVTES